MTQEAIVALATPVAVIVAAVIQQLNARRAAHDRKDIADGAAKSSESKEKKIDVIIQKTDEIHTLTDGNLSKVQESLKQANEHILELEKLLTAMAHKKANGGNEPDDFAHP